jgi:hypothetical protein
MPPDELIFLSERVEALYAAHAAGEITRAELERQRAFYTDLLIARGEGIVTITSRPNGAAADSLGAVSPELLLNIWSSFKKARSFYLHHEWRRHALRHTQPCRRMRPREPRRRSVRTGPRRARAPDEPPPREPDLARSPGGAR